MRAAVRFFLQCAVAALAAQLLSAPAAHAAPPVLRVKARLSSFDGTVMRLQTLASGAIKAGEDFSASVTPQTRYAGTAPSSFSALKPGAYAGAAVSEQRGRLRAQDVYLYPDALRGTGEGRFPEGGRLMIHGTIAAVKPTSAEDSQNGTVTLHYHGAVLSNAGPNRTLCEGRATPPPYASPLSCESDAAIEIASGTKVWVLAVGDKTLLAPGALVTVAMTKAEPGPDGDRNIAVGVVVEAPPPAAQKGTVEKPQSSP